MKCNFCLKEFKNKGHLFVKNDGTKVYYCSSKCMKNAKIRNPRKTKWTGWALKAKGKE
ncbi:MAG: 50S ribosomal protein L24e [Candidatus Nanohalarchaeota archaeon]|nr:MAG: 50S ribosomal protein L24e [Candidatus Nanohaloarchaeota archaeon]